jgi:hypothetical protein
MSELSGNSIQAYQTIIHCPKIIAVHATNADLIKIDYSFYLGHF